MTIIDSHLHLWDLRRGDYDWLTPENGALHASFLPEDVEAAISESDVDRVVLVQASDSIRDTEYMLDVAENRRWVAGVVGWVQLEDPEVAIAQLDELAARPAFRGVRHLVHGDRRADFLDLPPVRRSLGELARREIAFDIPDAWPRHLRQAIDVATEIPDLTVVLDHLGKPPRDASDFAEWSRQLNRFAAADRSAAKLSGLRGFAPVYSAAALEPAWSVALEAFGPSRLMWASDWPVSTIDDGYAETLAVLRELIATLSADEQVQILGATAQRTYALPQ